MPSAASKPFRKRRSPPATASPRRKTVPGAVQAARLTVKLPTISADPARTPSSLLAFTTAQAAQED
jgi:hypothetical protein